MFSLLVNISIGQQVSLTGKVINPDEKPIKKVFVYLANNPSLYCYSDTLGNFSLTNISTSVTEVRQNEIISFENRKFLLHTENKVISVDVFTVDGRQVMNIVNLNKSLGTFGLYPEAYISDLPKAIYIVRARVGSTFQSFKIQNIIPSGFPQGITEYDINNIIDNSFTEPKLEFNVETKSEALDTLVLVHDFYKSRKIPIDSYSIQYDTIHLGNFADYSIAEGFEPAVTYLYSGYGEFTNIRSEGDLQFIIDYDTLSLLENDLKIITIPVEKIENLNNSIKFISGLHLEPSGFQFLQPVQVTVLLKDSIPKNLVVFNCKDQGETYCIPYVSHALNSTRYYSVVFIINHFSSIGIGTGEINTDSDPSKFTTSEQFGSYLASYVSNDKLDELPEDFFTTWFNNVVAPKITGIITWEDFCEAYREFSLIDETWMRLGADLWGNPPFADLAREMFCEKVLRIWNNCKAEYNRLEDNCLKREILKIALRLFELNILIAGEGSFCHGFSLGDMNDLGNGEAFNLANEIKFTTPVKHLKIGDSFGIEYTLKNSSGNPPIPEVVSWSSSNPSVAEVDANGTVYAKKEGVARITGRICDIKNTLQVEIGGVNCEEDYCKNEYDSCYSGTYKCTGVLKYSGHNPTSYCESIDSFIQRYTFEGSLNHSFQEGYFEVIYSGEYDSWGSYSGECTRTYSFNTSYHIETGGFYCYGTEYFRYNPWGSGEPNFYGYLKENILIMDAKKWIGWEGVSYATTSMHCIRIDK